MAKKEVKERPAKEKRFAARFTAADLQKIGVDAEQSGRDISNAVRAKLKLPAFVASRGGKKAALIEKLGLPSEATNAQIQQAMLDRLSDE